MRKDLFTYRGDTVTQSSSDPWEHLIPEAVILVDQTVPAHVWLKRELDQPGGDKDASWPQTTVCFDGRSLSVTDILGWIKDFDLAFKAIKNDWIVGDVMLAVLSPDPLPAVCTDEFTDEMIVIHWIPTQDTSGDPLSLYQAECRQALTEMTNHKNLDLDSEEGPTDGIPIEDLMDPEDRADFLQRMKEYLAGDNPGM